MLFNDDHLTPEQRRALTEADDHADKVYMDGPDYIQGGSTMVSGDGYTEARVPQLPPCDFCKEAMLPREAMYDGKTNLGPWAMMCEEHYKEHGIGLGMGKGQKLILVHQSNYDWAKEEGLVGEEE